MATRKTSRAERLRLDRSVDLVLRDLAHVVQVEVCLNLAGLWDLVGAPLTRGECSRISEKLSGSSRNLADMAAALRTIRRRLPAGPPRETYREPEGTPR